MGRGRRKRGDAVLTSINGVATGFAVTAGRHHRDSGWGLHRVKESSREMTTLRPVAFVVLGGLLLGLAKSFDVDDECPNLVSSRSRRL